MRNLPQVISAGFLICFCFSSVMAQERHPSAVVGERWNTAPPDQKTSVIIEDIRSAAASGDLDFQLAVMMNLSGLYSNWRETPQEIQGALEEFVRANARRPQPVRKNGMHGRHSRGTHIPLTAAMNLLDPHARTHAEAVSLLSKNSTYERSVRDACITFLRSGKHFELLLDVASELIQRDEREDERLALLAFASSNRIPEEIKSRLVQEVTTPTLGIAEKIVALIPHARMSEDLVDVAIRIAKNKPEYAYILVRAVINEPPELFERYIPELKSLMNRPEIDAEMREKISRAISRSE